MDSRRLYLGEGCSSLFTYCTQVLRLSEHAAYGRIEAARAARRFPILLDLLADGWITLTTVCLLSPHLTPENHNDVLESARLKSKRDVEQIVAALRPQPPVATIVRKLPSPKPPALEPPDALSSQPATDRGGTTRARWKPTLPPGQRVQPSSARWRLRSTRSSSRCRVRCTIGCGKLRISSGT